MVKITDKLKARFFSKVKTGPGCWEWTGLKDRDGYGRYNDTMAHRVSWMIKYGDIPSGKFILHSCDNPGCVNPDHLKIGTNIDNMRDMVDRKRSLVGERSPRSKIKGSSVDRIRLMRRDGVRTIEIAKRFNISQRHVYFICNYERWGCRS